VTQNPGRIIKMERKHFVSPNRTFKELKTIKTIKSLFKIMRKGQKLTGTKPTFSIGLAIYKISFQNKGY
jgi:hypothetical protein